MNRIVSFRTTVIRNFRKNNNKFHTIIGLRTVHNCTILNLCWLSIILKNLRKNVFKNIRKKGATCTGVFYPESYYILYWKNSI